MQGAFCEMDDDIGWNDFALRNYDPQIGRWMQVDPFDQFASPYTGMGNDPVNGIDPSGGVKLPYINMNILTTTTQVVGVASKEVNTLSVIAKTASWASKAMQFARVGTNAASTEQVGPSPLAGAQMSKAVYGEKVDKIEGGWKISTLTLPTGVDLKNEKTGFKSLLYEREINGEKEYTYAFAGTEPADIKDWINDGMQLVGMSAQYEQAILNARALSALVGKSNITFVGHSLGGGLASAASLATGGQALTYNPAWLSYDTIFDNNLDVRGHQNKINNYIVKGEILNTSQYSIRYLYRNIIHLGTDHKLLNLPVFIKWGALGPVVAHSINSVIDAQ